MRTICVTVPTKPCTKRNAVAATAFAYSGGPPDEVAHLLAGVPEHLRRIAQSQLRLR